MQRETARNIMLAGAILLLMWFFVGVLRFFIGIAFFLGLVLVIIGAVMYLVSPRPGVG